LAQWPTLPNGKTNVEHLAGLVREDAREIDVADMPKTFAERKIAKIWMDVLKVDDVSLNDDFFEIGGDSLKSIHVMLAAEKEGIRLEPFQIFENPCLGPLAASVSEAINVDLDEPDAELSCMIREQAKGATVVMVHGSQKMCAYLSATIGDDRALFYHFSAYSKGRLLDRNIHDAGERIVRMLLEKRPNGPYIVGGYSAGALIAVEVARRLKMLGCAPQMIFLLDPSWEFKGVVGPDGDFVRSGSFMRQLAIRSLTQVRIAKTKALRWMMPHKERYRTSLVGQQTRSQLLAYVAAALDEQVRVYLSKESANLGLAEKWVNRVFVEPVYETLPYGHLELQSDEDALFEWCAKIAQLLAEAEEQEG
jgi:acyl carrier protein